MPASRVQLEADVGRGRLEHARRSGPRRSASGTGCDEFQLPPPAARRSVSWTSVAVAPFSTRQRERSAVHTRRCPRAPLRASHRRRPPHEPRRTRRRRRPLPRRPGEPRRPAMPTVRSRVTPPGTFRTRALLCDRARLRLPRAQPLEQIAARRPGCAARSSSSGVSLSKPASFSSRTNSGVDALRAQLDERAGGRPVVARVLQLAHVLGSHALAAQAEQHRHVEPAVAELRQLADVARGSRPGCAARSAVAARAS